MCGPPTKPLREEEKWALRVRSGLACCEQIVNQRPDHVTLKEVEGTSAIRAGRR